MVILSFEKPDDGDGASKQLQLPPGGGGATPRVLRRQLPPPPHPRGRPANGQLSKVPAQEAKGAQLYTRRER